MSQERSHTAKIHVSQGRFHTSRIHVSQERFCIASIFPVWISSNNILISNIFQFSRRLLTSLKGRKLIGLGAAGRRGNCTQCLSISNLMRFSKLCFVVLLTSSIILLFFSNQKQLIMFKLEPKCML